MNIFISWSGEQSLQVAEALRKWLPRVLQVIKPYLSKEDTAKGAYWVSEVKNQLDAAKFGIICLTPENLQAPWINFEAGALSKSVERASVTPFLFRVSQGDLTGPLTQFQVTEANNPTDVLRLLKQLDQACGDRAVGERVVEDSFDVWWPKLEGDLQRITAPLVIRPRPVDEMMLEVLNSQRTLERLIADSVGPTASRFMEVLVRQVANAPGPALRGELEDVLKRLAEALDACAASPDPTIKQLAEHVMAVRDVSEKLTGRSAMLVPLRSRINADQRGLPPGGS